MNISLNELFAGERIADADYKVLADKNLLSLLERSIYSSAKGAQDISFEEFSNAWHRMAETYVQLKMLGTREKAIAYMEKETGLSREECDSAYAFYDKLFGGQADKFN